MDTVAGEVFGAEIRVLVSSDYEEVSAAIHRHLKGLSAKASASGDFASYLFPYQGRLLTEVDVFEYPGRKITVRLYRRQYE